jgi:hypothetical protein
MPEPLIDPPAFLTMSQAARRLGVSPARVAICVQSGQMPIALLSGEDVDRLGPALAAAAPAFTWGPPPGSRKKPRPDPAPMPPALACGCIPGHGFCHDGAALSAAFRLADYLARSMPRRDELRRIADIARQELKRHLGQRHEVPALPPP